MKIEKIIKIKMEPNERQSLLDKVEDFVAGGFCEGVNCEGVLCSADSCPLYTLDELAQELRKKTFAVLEGAD